MLSTLRGALYPTTITSTQHQNGTGVQDHEEPLRTEREVENLHESTWGTVSTSQISCGGGRGEQRTLKRVILGDRIRDDLVSLFVFMLFYTIIYSTNICRVA